MKRTWVLVAWSLTIVRGAPAMCADDETQPPKAEKRAALRLEIMQSAINDFQLSSPEIEDEPALKFSGHPLLRYQDQSRESGGGIRGVLDATVWRLGTAGRPKAVVTLEIYLADQGYPFLTYEFVSLTSKKFTMNRARGVGWTPHSTDLFMAEFEQSPAPAETAKARLKQMRELARRFTAQEKLGAEKIELRLLSQPIDRYDDAAANILDGAMFVFANGTNPELGLLIECSEKAWSYGMFRLASARLLAQLDGKWVLQSTKPPGFPIDAPYTATRHGIPLSDDAEGE